MLLAEALQSLAQEVLFRDRLLVFDVGILQVAKEGGLTEVVKDRFMLLPGLSFGQLGWRSSSTTSAASYASSALIDLHEGAHVEVYVSTQVQISGIYNFSGFIPQLL